MKKNNLKKIIITTLVITVAINVVIAIVISARIIYQKTQDAITKQTAKSLQIPKFPGSGDRSSFYGSGQPVCVDASDYHTEIIYIRAKNTTSRYPEMAPKLRSWFKSADGIVSAEAKKFNVSADFKVLCDQGEISVIEAVLPNTSDYYFNASDTRGVLIRDLGVLGHNKKTVKYVVHYDGKASGCSQNGAVAPCIAQNSLKGPDDRLTIDNVYNSGPDYAFSYKVDEEVMRQYFGIGYDMMGPILILHEYAHTLGAVQPSAPHATKKERTDGQKHCIDSQTIGKGGTDIMCKSDGPGEVFGNLCPGLFPFHFDCNNDDYFNPKPEPGSYLATHWNLGSNLNRFIKFGQ